MTKSSTKRHSSSSDLNGMEDHAAQNGLSVVYEKRARLSDDTSDDDTSLSGQEALANGTNVIILYVDIQEPLEHLRSLLEARVGFNLTDHEIYLQDTERLDGDRSLVEQCVQGEGIVQVNVEIKRDPSPRINILDVLKLAEEVVQIDCSETTVPNTTSLSSDVHSPLQQTRSEPKVVIPFPDEMSNVSRWVHCEQWKKDAAKRGIPSDPALWSESHVQHWVKWAIKQFSLIEVHPDDFLMNGKQLCTLGHEQFVRRVPYDKDDLFWTHLELLRKCKFVAVLQQPTPNAITTITVCMAPSGKFSLPTVSKTTTVKTTPPVKIKSPRIMGIDGNPGNRTGNNGQIQLWQFLLELLTDIEYRPYIQWVGDDGEFKLNNPEMVAQLWGNRKNKPNMNYEKLSRALRYYYDGDMIAKVHGRRFVYKFVCDLKTLLGYSAFELNQLIIDCEQRKLEKLRDSIIPEAKKSVTVQDKFGKCKPTNNLMIDSGLNLEYECAIVEAQ